MPNSQGSQSISCTSSPYDPKDTLYVEGEPVFDGVDSQQYKKCGGGDFWNLFLSPRQKTRRKVKTSWKPVTLQAPVLGGFVILSLIMITVLEILSHLSLKNGSGGGLAFAPDTQSLPIGVSFGYLYFPTVLAVFYSMLWSWVDLDVKRLEPWFQLSKENGATFDDSLALQYPFDFLPFIPVTAFRRKHWEVFLAGTVMLMVFWIITPLQSAIFNTASITRSVATHMVATAALSPFELQSSKLTVNFLNTAYGVAWLGQRLPPFTTMEFATLPFQPESAPNSTMLDTETWSTSADGFGTSLNCTPALITRTIDHDLTYTFDNGRGCIVPEISLPSGGNHTKVVLQYFSYYNDPHVDSSLANPNCSAEHSSNFLAVWAGNVTDEPGIFNNITAAFCVPSYHVQSLVATVNASNHAIINSTNSTTEGRASLPDNFFNTTQFEYVIGVGLSSTAERVDHQDNLILEQFPQLEKFGLVWPTSNMVGFAVGLSGLPEDSLSSVTGLQDVFEKAHRVLFSTAINTLSTDPPNGTKPTWEGTRRETLGAVVLVRSIAIIVEAALGLITLLALSLWHISHKQRSKLLSNPASIADVMSMSSKDLSLSSYLREDSTATKSQDPTRTRFQLVDDGSRVKLMTVFPNMSYESSDDVQTVKPPSAARTTQLYIRPRELRIWAGISLIGIIVVSIITVVYLLVHTSKNNGITRPSTNPIILSVLENYLPTAFATFLEPAWVILNRLLCLLKPFEELRKGNAKFSKSIGAKYTSLPPQLTILRAMRSGHIMLAAVGIIAISANILAVALAGMFEERLVTTLIPAITKPTLLPQFNGTTIETSSTTEASFTYQDHFYVAMSSLEDGTPLPPWVDQDYFYIPFPLNTMNQTMSASQQLQGYRSSTMGFGTEVSCSELSPGNAQNGVSFQTAQNGTTAQLSTTHKLQNGTSISCELLSGTESTFLPTSNADVPVGGPRLALETMQTMVPAESECGSLLIAGWVRAQNNGTGVPDSEAPDRIRLSDVNGTFMSCSASLRAGHFDVVVDASGRVLSSEKTKDVAAEDMGQFFKGNDTASALIAQSWTLLTPSTLQLLDWHNDTLTSDWINALLRFADKSSTLVDPAASVPVASVVGPRLESLLQELFAIMLGLNTRVFANAGDVGSVPGSLVVLETRIFMAPVMAQLCIAILACHLVVAVLYYAFRPKVFLPRMPTSIAAVMSYVCASRISGDDKEERYGYGRFLGTDGEHTLGLSVSDMLCRGRVRIPM